MFAIKYNGGGWYLVWTGIGPSFGADTPAQAAHFTKAEALQMLGRHWSFVMADVVDLRTGEVVGYRG